MTTWWTRAATVSLVVLAMETLPFTAAGVSSTVVPPAPTKAHTAAVVASAVPSGQLTVSVPVVAFSEQVSNPAGFVEVGVLLADPAVRGVARVVGGGPGQRCSAPLIVGVVVMLVCPTRQGRPPTSGIRVVAELSDGRSFEAAPVSRTGT